MKLDPTPLQQELVEAVIRLLERECDSGRVRNAESSGFDAALWSEIVELGIPFMGLSEDHGGIVALLQEGFTCPGLCSEGGGHDAVEVLRHGRKWGSCLVHGRDTNVVSPSEVHSRNSRASCRQNSTELAAFLAPAFCD